MHLRRDIFVAALLMFRLTVSGAAPRTVDAAALLRKVRQQYLSLRSFQLKGVSAIETQTTSNNVKMDLPFEADFASPAKVRVEITNSRSAVLIVSDGVNTWIYAPSSNTYDKIDLEAPPESSPPHSSGGDLDVFNAAAGAAGLGFDVVESGIADGIKEANILRDEKVELDGKQVACHVVRVEYNGPSDTAGQWPDVKTYWIDEERLIVVRESWETRIEGAAVTGGGLQAKHTIILTSARLNQPVPDELFKFVPPKGAKLQVQASVR